MKNNLKKFSIILVLAGIMLIPIVGLKLTHHNYNVSIQIHWGKITISILLIILIFIAKIFFHYIRQLKVRITLFSSLHTIKFQNNYLKLLMIISVIFWPFFANRTAIDLGTVALIYVILGLGLNIVVGFAGLLDLGFVGFYAIGAYTYALLSYWGNWTFWEALPLSGIISAIFGLLLGFPVLGLRGDYLAIVTLGFGEIIRLLLINLNQWTLGPDGISDLPKPGIFGMKIANTDSKSDISSFYELIGSKFDNLDMIYLYLTVLILAWITFLIPNRLIRMPIGRAWEALREDEIACSSLGLNPKKIKLSAFTLGAFFAGLGGSFFAARQGAINPESFTFLESILILSIVILGGMGSQAGVILSAILLTIIPELMREFSEYRMMIFGLIMVLMMVFRPKGLLPMRRPYVKLD